MTRFAAKHCKLNESQYGSKASKLCQSAILNKVLTYDLFRITKREGAVAEFNAMANVTSLQMDIKITGITEEIMQVALDQAKGGAP